MSLEEKLISKKKPTFPISKSLENFLVKFDYRIYGTNNKLITIKHRSIAVGPSSHETAQSCLWVAGVC